MRNGDRCGSGMGQSVRLETAEVCNRGQRGRFNCRGPCGMTETNEPYNRQEKELTLLDITVNLKMR